MAIVTPAVISWLLRQSMAQRGRLLPVDQTCPTFGAWVDLVTGNGGPGRFEQLLRVPYPEPTPVTVCLSLTQPGGTSVQNSQRSKLYGAAPFGPVPAPLEVLAGTILIEWIVAGSQFSAMVDLGAGALSIPAVDQITVSYASPIPAGASPGQVSVSVVPALSPGAVATQTKVPAVIAAGAFAPIATQRQSFARRWKLTACQTPAPGAIVPIGPLVVMAGPATDPYEQVQFRGGVAGGLEAADQGWIECGPAEAYAVRNLGGVDVLASIIEQLQVA